MLKVKTSKLMIIAGIVWFIAGANIFNLGLHAFFDIHGALLFWVLVAGAALVFSMFHIKVFTKMVAKHTARIYAYDEPRRCVFSFFDAKGYVMMGIMMGGGIGLRMTGLIPEWFIAFFYSGIGFALMTAGIDFLVRYFKDDHAWGCPALPKNSSASRS